LSSAIPNAFLLGLHVSKITRLLVRCYIFFN